MIANGIPSDVIPIYIYEQNRHVPPGECDQLMAAITQAQIQVEDAQNAASRSATGNRENIRIAEDNLKALMDQYSKNCGSGPGATGPYHVVPSA